MMATSGVTVFRPDSKDEQGHPVRVIQLRHQPGVVPGDFRIDSDNEAVTFRVQTVESDEGFTKIQVALRIGRKITSVFEGCYSLRAGAV